MTYGFDDVHPLDTPKSKTCIVTGGNSGVGYICVRELYRAGWRVVFTVRTDGAGTSTVQAVKEAVGSQPKCGELVPLLLDLSDTGSIKKFVADFKAANPKLHMLMNNAAVGPNNRYRTTAEGHEYTWATNHLGHYSLTQQLLQTMVDTSGPTRVVNVASGNLTKACKDPLAVFDDSKRNSKKAYGFNGAGAYKRSKICNVWFTDVLAEKLQKAGITTVSAHCVNPGKHGDSKILTHAFRNMSWWSWIVVGWFLWFRYRRNPPPCDLAALVMIYVATEPKYDKERAAYVSSKKDLKARKVEPFEDTIPERLTKPEYPQELWDLSARLTGMDFFKNYKPPAPTPPLTSA